jgi:hypothetical protein
MDGWTDIPTNGQTNRKTDRPTDCPTNRQTDRPTDCPTNQPTDRPTMAGFVSEMGQDQGHIFYGRKKPCGHTDVITNLRSHQKEQTRKDPKRRHYESTGSHFYIRKETYLAFAVLVVFQPDLVKNEYPPQPMRQPYLVIKGHHGHLLFCFGQSS